MISIPRNATAAASSFVLCFAIAVTALAGQSLWITVEAGPDSPPFAPADGIHAGGRSWTPAQPPHAFAVPLQLQPRSREFLPLQSSKAVVANRPEGPTRTIRIALRRTHYYGTYLRRYDDQTEQSPKVTLHCYELVPANGQHGDPYSWAMWQPNSPWLPRSFWLFTLDEGQTYLVFAHRRLRHPFPICLSLVNVTQSRDRLSAFSEDLAGAPEEGTMFVTWERTTDMLVRLGILPPAVASAESAELKELLREEKVKRGVDLNASWLRPEPTSLRLDENGSPVLGFKLTRTAVRGTLAVRDGELELTEVQQDRPGRKPETGDEPTGRTRR